MTSTEKIQQLLNAPCTSFWLKNALRTLLERDVLDATRDAELLASLMAERFDEITGQASST